MVIITVVCEYSYPSGLSNGVTCISYLFRILTVLGSPALYSFINLKNKLKKNSKTNIYFTLSIKYTQDAGDTHSLLKEKKFFKF